MYIADAGAIEEGARRALMRWLRATVDHGLT